jgi:hypothetical protein
VAHAYLDQLARSEAVSKSFVAELAAALDRSEAQLLNGARDKDLADALESQAAALGKGEGDTAAMKQRVALGEVLGEIAARLR